jgi:hypothetical protein
MYFRLSDNEQKQWNEKDEDWYKPVVCKKAISIENFEAQTKGGLTYFLIVIVLLSILAGAYFLYKKKTSS